MTPDLIPRHDHGAAGFCTDHAQVPDERTETVARVAYRALYPGHINTHDSARTPESDAAERDRAYETWDAGREGYAPGRTCRDLAAAVVAALDDETARLRERWQAVVSAPSFEAAVTVEAVAYHDTECSYRADVVQLRDALVLANTTTRKAIADLAAARAALDQMRARIAAEIIDVRRTPSRIKGGCDSLLRRHVEGALHDAAVRVRDNEHAEDEYPADWLDPMSLDPEEPR